MKTILLLLVVVGNLKVTSYRAVKEQTDDSPFYTSTNERVKVNGCAVSRDVLCSVCLRLHRRCGNPKAVGIHYGDWLYIQKYGFRQVNDVMGPNNRKSVDIYVQTYEEEKQVGTRHLKVYRLIRGKNER
jgi:hypothetical protein